jgi:hypothetical protein
MPCDPYPLSTRRVDPNPAKSRIETTIRTPNKMKREGGMGGGGTGFARRPDTFWLSGGETGWRVSAPWACGPGAAPFAAGAGWDVT